MFKQARPVWPKGRETEMNISAVFEERTGSLRDTTLHVAACSFYRLFVNDRFVAFGPARTASGYARVDILPLSEYDSCGENHLRLEVVGYYCRSLSTCRQPSFLCAELRRGETVLAATGRDFTCRILSQKEQYVQRYSIQRHFGEVWDLTRESTEIAPVEIRADAPVFLPRVAPYPHYEDIILATAACCGIIEQDDTLPVKHQHYSWKEVPEFWGRFEDNEIPRKPYQWIQQQRRVKTAGSTPLPLALSANTYAFFDFLRIECGFLALEVDAHTDCEIVIAFTEYCEGDTFAFSNLNCHNVLEYVLPAGRTNRLLSFEPYTAREAIVAVKSGSLTLRSFGIKTFERDMENAKNIAFSNPVHGDIYKAALRTFAHNAVDLYSDCPSRERAGWLCDSYFTGDAEYHFLGEVPVEDAFLENFRLFKDPTLATGMLPMCYPADIKQDPDGGGHHIPQWCMWYVLEVEDYLTRRNPKVDPELFRETVTNIVNYLARYENSDGLLEDLPSWNFVEWSDANKWTQNVNYPTNFLYSAVLDATCRLYGDSSLAKKAAHIRQRTAALSFDGELFTDNAVRNESGALQNTGNTSEAGQYYALLFGNLDLDAPRYAALKAYLPNHFEGVAESGRRFVPVNAFIGLYLRIKTLLKLEWYELLLEDISDFFGGMAEKTGTLWEYRQMKGSFDHGFASYAAYAMCVALEKMSQKS